MKEIIMSWVIALGCLGYAEDTSALKLKKSSSTSDVKPEKKSSGSALRKTASAGVVSKKADETKKTTDGSKKKSVFDSLTKKIDDVTGKTAANEKKDKLITDLQTIYGDDYVDGAKAWLSKWDAEKAFLTSTYKNVESLNKNDYRVLSDDALALLKQAIASIESNKKFLQSIIKNDSKSMLKVAVVPFADDVATSVKPILHPQEINSELVVSAEIKKVKKAWESADKQLKKAEEALAKAQAVKDGAETAANAAKAQLDEAVNTCSVRINDAIALLRSGFFEDELRILTDICESLTQRVKGHDKSEQSSKAVHFIEALRSEADALKTAIEKIKAKNVAAPADEDKKTSDGHSSDTSSDERGSDTSVETSRDSEHERDVSPSKEESEEDVVEGENPLDSLQESTLDSESSRELAVVLLKNKKDVGYIMDHTKLTEDEVRALKESVERALDLLRDNPGIKTKLVSKSTGLSEKEVAELI